jgi:hypothetical protein
MATAIDPADLRPHLDTYGLRATVVTVADDRVPHVGTSLVELDGDRVVIRVGKGAAGNLATNPELCLTWAPPPGVDYQLIVDGTAVDVKPDGTTFVVIVEPRSGIRHRVADAPGTGPSCIALDER